MFLDQEANASNSKRYSFLVKTAGSPNRRPLTSKNTFGNAPQQDQPKPEEPRKCTSDKYGDANDDRNDENIEKKYLSMTPTNVRKAQ